MIGHEKQSCTSSSFLFTDLTWKLLTFTPFPFSKHRNTEETFIHPYYRHISKRNSLFSFNSFPESTAVLEQNKSGWLDGKALKKTGRAKEEMGLKMVLQGSSLFLKNTQCVLNILSASVLWMVHQYCTNAIITYAHPGNVSPSIAYEAFPNIRGKLDKASCLYSSILTLSTVSKLLPGMPEQDLQHELTSQFTPGQRGNCPFNPKEISTSTKSEDST